MMYFLKLGFPFIVLLLLTSPLLVFASPRADNNNPEPLGNPANQVRFYVETYHLNQKPKLIKRVIKRVEGIYGIGATKSGAEISNSSTTPIVHLKGNSQVEIKYVSSKSEMPQIPSYSEFIAKREDDKSPRSSYPRFSKEMTPPKLLLCTKSKTFKSKLNENSETSSIAKLSGRNSVDILFLKRPNREDAPLLTQDLRELFGTNVHVFFYSDKEGDLFSVNASKEFNLSCLPTRFRVSNGKVLKEEGKNALRNYELGSSKKGGFHRIVERELDEYF